MRALIIEDDHDQALYNSEALARLGIHSEIVDTSTEANLKMHRSNYDVIMVDMELKGGTRGEEVLDYAKTFSPTTLRVVLSGANKSDDISFGYREGAEIYLTKPIQAKNIAGAIAPILERTTGALDFKPITLSGVHLDPKDGNFVHRDGKLINLAPYQFKILHVLMKAHGRPVNRNELFFRVWKTDKDVRNGTLNQRICQLRKNLGKPDLIVTKDDTYAFLVINP